MQRAVHRGPEKQAEALCLCFLFPFPVFPPFIYCVCSSLFSSSLFASYKTWAAVRQPDWHNHSIHTLYAKSHRLEFCKLFLRDHCPFWHACISAAFLAAHSCFQRPVPPDSTGAPLGLDLWGRSKVTVTFLKHLYPAGSNHEIMKSWKYWL